MSVRQLFHECRNVIFQPESVIMPHPYFVVLSVRLVSAFIEDVADHIEKKQETRLRQLCVRRMKRSAIK